MSDNFIMYDQANQQGNPNIPPMPPMEMCIRDRILIMAFAKLYKPQSWYILCLPGILIYLGYGMLNVIMPIFLSDSVAYGEVMNGTRAVSYTHLDVYKRQPICTLLSEKMKRRSIC